MGTKRKADRLVGFKDLAPIKATKDNDLIAHSCYMDVDTDQGEGLVVYATSEGVGLDPVWDDGESLRPGIECEGGGVYTPTQARAIAEALVRAAEIVEAM